MDTAPSPGPEPDRRSPQDRTRSGDRGWRILLRENAYRDLWLFLITIFVFLALKGCGPIHVQGIDDVARSSNSTAQYAKNLARVNQGLVSALQAEVDRSRITRNEVRQIAREQAAPSVKQILTLIARANQVCKNNLAACQAATSQTHPNIKSSPSSGSTGPSSGSGGPKSPGGGKGHRTQRHPKRAPSPSGGGGGSSTSTGSSPPAPPAKQPSVIQVTTPLPHPPVCVDHIISVDCP